MIDGGDVFVRRPYVPSTDVCMGLCPKMSNSLLTDAISAAAADMIGC